MDDLTPRRLAAQLKDLQSTAGPLAEYLAVLHRSFMDAGFTREEALALVLEMERCLLVGLTKPVNVVLPQARVDFHTDFPPG